MEWSEAIVSCAGSVSQYVLSVTPPTSDCQSSPDCMVMDGSSIITTPGTETQYSINISGISQIDVTVRADTCDNTLTGEMSSIEGMNLGGKALKLLEEVAQHNYDECSTAFMHVLAFQSLQ